MSIRFPKPGEQVKFTDGRETMIGVCNGEPRALDEDRPWVLTHLPVHIHATNDNLMVACGNIIEWPEA